MTKINSVNFVLALVALAMATYIACAYDPGPLQDFCVAIDDPKHVCKCYRSIFISLFYSSSLPTVTLIYSFLLVEEKVDSFHFLIFILFYV